MAASWFVTPSIVRLPLSDGQWLDVKQELTAGEERAMFAAMGELRPETRLAGSGVREQWIVAYVLAWSLTDDEGRPVAFSAGALDALRGARLAEIWDAINAHDERVRDARDEEKKTRDGINPSPPS
jgi:hypothetical protein